MAATIVGKPAAPDKLNQTARQLFARFCQEFVAEGFSEVGQYRDGDRLYLVFARPRRSITADDIPVIRAQLLELVNQARSVPRQCGDKPYAAASPVRYSNDLARAAVVHAADMARRNQLDHLGSDGSNPGERISRAGFRWRVVGENLALGFDNAAEVVRGWLDSPVHCENIMDARFEDMGVAFAISSGPDAVVYWAQSLAAPASPKPARVTASR